MSDYPKSYGFCDAGCRRRVVPYEEFLNSASITKHHGENGTYFLEKGRAYRLKNDNSTTEWGFIIVLDASWNTGSGTAVGMLTIDLPAFDKYSKGLKFSLLDVAGVYDSSTQKCSFTAVYELNGERHTETFVNGDYSATSKPTADITYRAVAMCQTSNASDLKCWLFNEDAQIEFEVVGDGEKELPPVSTADNGKILRVVGGKWTATTEKTEKLTFTYEDGSKRTVEVCIK